MGTSKYCLLKGSLRNQKILFYSTNQHNLRCEFLGPFEASQVSVFIFVSTKAASSCAAKLHQMSIGLTFSQNNLKASPKECVHQEPSRCSYASLGI